MLKDLRKVIFCNIFLFFTLFSSLIGFQSFYITKNQVNLDFLNFSNFLFSLLFFIIFASLNIYFYLKTKKSLEEEISKYSILYVPEEIQKNIKLSNNFDIFYLIDIIKNYYKLIKEKNSIIDIQKNKISNMEQKLNFNNHLLLDIKKNINNIKIPNEEIKSIQEILLLSETLFSNNNELNLLKNKLENEFKNNLKNSLIDTNKEKMIINKINNTLSNNIDLNIIILTLLSNINEEVNENLFYDLKTLLKYNYNNLLEVKNNISIIFNKEFPQLANFYNEKINKIESIYIDLIKNIENIENIFKNNISIIRKKMNYIENSFENNNKILKKIEEEINKIEEVKIIIENNKKENLKIKFND